MRDSSADLLLLPTSSDRLALAQAIETCVLRAANGRIHDLHVDCSEDGIVLKGRSRTYHAKQVAHQAVLDYTDGHPLLNNQIIVA